MRQSWTTGFWGRAALIVVLALTAAVGFCIFDGDHGRDHRAVSVDLCSGMLAATLAPGVVLALLLAGAAVLVFTPEAAGPALGVLVPPPRFVLPR